MSTAAWLALIASTAIDLAVLVGVLLVHRASVVSLSRLLLALLATAIVFVGKLVLLLPFVSSFFYVIHLAYADTMVTVPLAGASVLLAARRRKIDRSVRVLACLALAIGAIGVYATFVEPSRLVEEHATIPISPERAGRAPIRIAVLADIQGRDVEPQMRAAVASAMKFEPHLIVLPGDLIQRGAHDYDEAVPSFRELLQPLDAPLGVYFVLGNTDKPERVGKVFEGTHVRLLHNDVVELAFEDRKIVLGGGGMNVRGGLELNFIAQLEARAGDDDVRLLLTHYPDAMLHLSPNSRVDLVIAGHTHGGQVQIPFFGPPIKLSDVSREVAAGGYHVVDGRAIYVSRGIGCERGTAPRVRFLAPPEVSLLTLETR